MARTADVLFILDEEEFTLSTLFELRRVVLVVVSIPVFHVRGIQGTRGAETNGFPGPGADAFEEDVRIVVRPGLVDADAQRGQRQRVARAPGREGVADVVDREARVHAEAPDHVQHLQCPARSVGGFGLLRRR